MLVRSILQNIRPFTSTYIIQAKHLKMSAPSLESIPKVDIETGVFKYILIQIFDAKLGTPDHEPNVIVVRGYKECNYHSDILDKVQAQLPKLDCSPLGGGRISHDAEAKKIHIYGYSQGFGKADHEVTAKLVKDAYPGYTVTISDEGY